tara:strand:- start:6207 stop:6764 length:558 start_codon:yes stop_codon:yes gene_type:complete
MQLLTNSTKLLISIILTCFVISCAQIQNSPKNPEKTKNSKVEAMERQLEKRDVNLPPGSNILEDGAGLNLGNMFDFGGSTNLGTASLTFDVALDQVDFMPLVSVDSVSGVIVTDWYSLDEGNTRMKINIRVVDQQMTDESLIVSLFTQSLKEDRWVDNGINTEQSQKIKNSILSSARALKIASEL